MAVLKFMDTNNVNTRWRFHCPGCKRSHTFNSAGKEPVWQFNGDVDKPTVTPSLLVNKSHPESRCHSFITDGQIRFLSDCHHSLAGKTVPLPQIEGSE